MAKPPVEITDIDDDFFDICLSAEDLKNKRTAIRYIRKDISASFCVHGFFNFSKFRPVELIDISSKGATFRYTDSIPLKQKIIFSLVFEDKAAFKIHAKIVCSDENKFHYGIKFDRFNNKLGDYLLSSQKDLIFK